MRFPVLATALTLLAAATPAQSRAQGVPDLSGTWKLVTDQSDFGPMLAPQSRTDVIDHKEPKLNIKRTVVTGAGETSSSLVYAIDNTPYKNMAGGQEITSTLKWEAQTLVMASTLATGQGDVGINDRITLSSDGKTLTMARTLSLGGQELAQKMVFAKQP